VAGCGARSPFRAAAVQPSDQDGYPDKESEHPVKDDRERLHDLVVEQEEHEAEEAQVRGTAEAHAGQPAPRTAAAAPPTSNSDQAQANLEKMLETGEENAIS